MPKNDKKELSGEVQKAFKSIEAKWQRDLNRLQLLRDVEKLWALDEEFRFAIRKLVKDSPLKDKGGNKPFADPNFLAPIVGLAVKLGLKRVECEDLIADHYGFGDKDAVRKLFIRHKRRSLRAVKSS